MTKQKKCVELVDEMYFKTVQDYKSAKNYFDLDTDDRSKNQRHEDLECYEDFFDYVNQSGLSFDFVPVDTFEDQQQGYWRFQMSWGGPSDEFRIYVDDQNKIEQIYYHYMDWYDGASKLVQDNIIYDICQMFLDGCDCKDNSEIYKNEDEEAA